jgi:hypothetical protein
LSGSATCSEAAVVKARKGRLGRVFYGQGNDFNNLSGENASALGFLDAILGGLNARVNK